MATITSAGYDNYLFEADHVVMTPKYGADYWVESPNDFAASIGAGDRVLNISAGTAGGRGVKDEMDVEDQVTFTAAAAGQQRWDMVCLRRDWQPVEGGPTSLTVVPGGTVMALPGGRLNTPAVVDDHPLYLQQIVGTVLGERIDLRTYYGNGNLVAADDLARSYLTSVGTRVHVLSTGKVWVLTPGANGIASWSDDPVAARVTAMTPIFDGWHDLRPWLKNGWQASDTTSIPRWRKVTDASGSYVELRGQVAHPTASGNSPMVYFGPDYRPKSIMYFGGLNARTNVAMGAVIGTDGILTMWSESPSGGLRSLNSIKYYLD